MCVWFWDSNSVTLSWIINWCTLSRLRVLCHSSPAWTALLLKQQWWVKQDTLMKPVSPHESLYSHFMITIVLLIACCSLSGANNRSSLIGTCRLLTPLWCHSSTSFSVQQSSELMFFLLMSAPSVQGKNSICAVFRLLVKCLQHGTVFQPGTFEQIKIEQGLWPNTVQHSLVSQM